MIYFGLFLAFLAGIWVGRVLKARIPVVDHVVDSMVKEEPQPPDAHVVKQKPRDLDELLKDLDHE